MEGKHSRRKRSCCPLPCTPTILLHTFFLLPLLCSLTSPPSCLPLLPPSPHLSLLPPSSPSISSPLPPPSSFPPLLLSRPPHMVGVIGTSQLYSVHGAMMAFTPQFLDHEAFYLCLDSKLLVDLIRTDLAYLKTNWKVMGRPTIVLPILRYICCLLFVYCCLPSIVNILGQLRYFAARLLHTVNIASFPGHPASFDGHASPCVATE